VQLGALLCCAGLLQAACSSESDGNTLPGAGGAGANVAFGASGGQGWGNEGSPHNYHFTYELHAAFVYQGGEVFTFTGHDDLFTFVNRKLGIDLGGVHGAESATIDLDAAAGDLGIAPGGTYDLDFFFAERHTTESHFRIDTTISFIDCGPPPPT